MGHQLEPRNLNALLSDIYRRYIAIRDEDFDLHFTVLNEVVFEQLHRTMKQVDPYYAHYHSQVSLLGSHFDRLRVEKPDEFDICFEINLPISMEINRANPEDSDINFKMGKRGSAYMELKMGTQFRNLPKRADWEINKCAYKWMDKMYFLSRAKFYSWFQKVVDKSLNKFRSSPRSKSEPKFYVEGVEYTVRRKQSGPAVTLIIENIRNDFCLHVDLVPALRFSNHRWPIGKQYTKIPEGCEHWLVVPKPDKQWQGGVLWTSRSWRASLHFQEQMIVHDLYNLRQIIRLLKKLRNALGLHEIKSYFIKTLFLWKASSCKPKFWKNSPAYLFKVMVEELYVACCKGKIRYFWNKKCNLLDRVEKDVLTGYSLELEELLDVLDDPGRFMEVADFILSEKQLEDYLMTADETSAEEYSSEED